MSEFSLIVYVLIAITSANLLVSIFKKPKIDLSAQLKEITDLMLGFNATLERNEKSIKDEFQRNRAETSDITKSNRQELTQSLDKFSEQLTKELAGFNELLRQKFIDLANQQTVINKQTTQNVHEIKTTIEKQLKDIRDDNTKQLDKMRDTVDEKLQKTLNLRLSQSFETVNKQLSSVQKGLGEMQNLAQDVGGLKKVLGNVKMRGVMGEVQLEMLLEQMLSSNQYQANVNTNKDSRDTVEFAIKLPGKNDNPIWLPIDAKFPKDRYEKLVDAYDIGDKDGVNTAKKEMESTIKKMAKDISNKYISPPDTTDFAIMFLPFEAIYAEVINNVSLVETLQRDFKVIVTGPNTLAAILYSFQMGFKTLAIEKRSSEVWDVLAGVKKEFTKFEDIMGSAQKNIQSGLNRLDELVGTRTKAIQRKLKNVEELPSTPQNMLIDSINQNDHSD